MYYKAPPLGRTEWFCYYGIRPISMARVKDEIENNTEKGNKLLKMLGYEDDNDNKTKQLDQETKELRKESDKVVKEAKQIFNL